jgi:anti-sigma regulatory factor (Ser/Thr protein kinase)
MTVRMLDPLDLRLDAVITSVPRARHQLASWLSRSRVDRETRDELALVITELVTNAIEASPGANAQVEIRAEVAAGPQVVLTVSDAGAGFQMAGSPRLPAGPVIRGRGLPIVNALMDELDVRRIGGRTRVRTSRAVRS